jgi:hypothetical protein
MIESPRIVGDNLRIAGHSLGFFGGARRWVLHFIKRLREAGEIVDGLRMGG